ncbi:MAG: hypothetical protein ABI237_04150 [Ginsengibacter sp.]
MKKSTDYSIISDSEECLPRISLIIPYESRRNRQPELHQWLTIEADKIEKELIKTILKKELRR